MKCGTCGLDLPAGAVHVSPQGCIEALREALDGAAECVECGESVPWPLHPACMAKAVARKGSSAAIDEGYRRAVQAAARFFGKKEENPS